MSLLSGVRPRGSCVFGCPLHRVAPCVLESPVLALLLRDEGMWIALWYL